MSDASRKEILAAIAGCIERGDCRCSHDPLEWFFELSKLCNIRCRTCGRLYDDRFKDPGFAGNMKLEIMERVESHLSSSFLVHSVGFGEPFLNRRLMDFIRIIKRNGPYLDIITNGTLLSGKLDQIIDSELDELVVSMDGGNAEIFDYFRVGARWADVAASLAELHRKKKECGATKPVVTIEFVAMRGNLPTLPRLVEVAATEWGVRGITVENLYQIPESRYMKFYLEQNLYGMPFDEVEAWFRKCEEEASKHGIHLVGPYFDGDRHELWKNACVKAVGGVDHPSHNRILNEPVPFSGWAVHPGGIEKVLFHLKSGASGEARYGLPRRDAEEVTDTGPCGFEFPMNPDMMKQGRDELFITVEDRTGGSTAFAPVIFHFEPSSLPPLVVDYPAEGEPVDHETLILGWYLPPLPDALVVQVDDRDMGEAVFGLERPDVKARANRLGIHHPDLDRCGFYLPLDLADFAEGAHRLRIFCLFSGEQWKEVFSEKFEMKTGCRRDGRIAARAMGKIEQPGGGRTVGEGDLFSGWVVYGAATERLMLLCDDEEAGVLGHMIPREDVRKRIGDPLMSNRLGFFAPLGVASAGERTFSLVAVTRDGDREVLDRLTCTVKAAVRHNPEQQATPPRKPQPVYALRRSTERVHAQKEFLSADPSKHTAFLPYCTLPWTTTYIAFDGLVRPCCFSDPMMVLGDLSEKTFTAIWNGEAYRLLRSEILEGMVPEGCRNCVANARIHGRAIFDKFNKFIEQE